MCIIPHFDKLVKCFFGENHNNLFFDSIFNRATSKKASVLSLENGFLYTITNSDMSKLYKWQNIKNHTFSIDNHLTM